jgi:hypothetical protein
MNKNEILTIFFTILLISSIFLSYNVEACKDIVACGDATAGDYNLLLKVRDPSRPGIQVLCIVPKDYKYKYHHPWSGKNFESETLHKYIGVATKGDTIPNIVKAGMTLTDAGISYGDADTGSRWVNPTKNAWDDFDWIRYACEKADSVDQATTLLTKDAVKKMHATGVSENLFIVGPEKGIVIEADAFHYIVDEIENGIVVMSNYPKKLWKTQRFDTFLISRNFDTVKEKNVRSKGTVRLNSLFCIRVLNIENEYISVKPIFLLHALKSYSLGNISKISIGERKTVGYFSVELLDIDKNKASVRVTNKYKAWEEEILKHIEPKYGDISIKEMINWSRLHEEDLSGLRAMCEDFFEFEAVTIYKIPKKNYEILSSGWFSANHACSSIYVPFHICNNDIYDAYETGEAAELSLVLLNEYGHKKLEESFSNVEEVFLNEIDAAEKISLKRIDNSNVVSNYLTIVDNSMQKQAYLTQEIWLDISKIKNEETKDEIKNIVNAIWKNNYSSTLENIKNSVYNITKLPKNIVNKLCNIGLEICKSKIDSAVALEKDCSSVNDLYKKASQQIEDEKYELGFDNIIKSFNKCNRIINGQSINNENDKNKSINANFPLITFIILLIVGIIFLIIVGLKQKR